MKALLICLSLVLLGGVAWLLWGGASMPHPSEQATPAQPGPPQVAEPVAVPPVAAASEAKPVISVGVGATVQPVLAPPPKPPANAWQEVERRIPAEQKQLALQGPRQPFAVQYNNLQKALEEARRAFPAASAASAPEPAPGAGINPFGSR